MRLLRNDTRYTENKDVPLNPISRQDTSKSGILQRPSCAQIQADVRPADVWVDSETAKKGARPLWCSATKRRLRPQTDSQDPAWTPRHWFTVESDVEWFKTDSCAVQVHHLARRWCDDGFGRLNTQRDGNTEMLRKKNKHWLKFIMEIHWALRWHEMCKWAENAGNA